MIEGTAASGAGDRPPRSLPSEGTDTLYCTIGGIKRLPRATVQVLFWTGCCALTVAAGLVAAAAAPVLFGLQSAIVVSGSMEPTISLGSVVVARALPADEIRTGDVITYYSVNQPEVLVTHRVVGVEGSGPTLRLRTKGDANAAEDVGGVNVTRPVSRLLYSVPMAGYVLTYLSDGGVRILLLGAGLLLFWMRSALGTPRERAKNLGAVQPETREPLRASAANTRTPRVASPLSWASLLAAAAVLLVMFGMAAALGPALLGFRTLVVETPSLEPAVPHGAVMVQEVVPPALLRPGDLISFTADRNPGVVFTHRVLRVRPETAAVELRTQGPSGGEEELWLVHPGQPVGRLVYWIPLVGVVARHLTGPLAWGVLIVVGVLLMWFALRPSRVFAPR
jgi:signal peptidase